MVVNDLVGTKRMVRRALAGDSNDAEHDALYEVEGTLGTLTPEVRRMATALRLCLKLLQTNEIMSTSERRYSSLWRATVRSAKAALD